jgi:hypothetical protein
LPNQLNFGLLREAQLSLSAPSRHYFPNRSDDPITVILPPFCILLARIKLHQLTFPASMIKNAILASAFAFLLVGCAAPTKTIKFDSEPRGARVFLVYGANENIAEGAKGRNFLGVTPFEWTTEIEGNGTFKVKATEIPIYSEFVQSVIVFVADPPSGATNLYPQREVFHTDASFQRGTPAPDGMFFDLTKPPAAIQVPAKKSRPR